MCRWPPDAWRHLGWRELMLRYRKLRDRQANRQGNESYRQAVQQARTLKGGG